MLRILKCSVINASDVSAFMSVLLHKKKINLMEIRKIQQTEKNNVYTFVILKN